MEEVRTFSLSELAALVSGTVVGENISVTGICTPDAQRAGALCIVTDKKYAAAAEEGVAVAVIGPEEAGAFQKPVIRTAKGAKEILIALLAQFYPAVTPVWEISPMACIAPSATVAEEVRIEAFVRIGENVSVGKGTVIMSGAVVGANVRIGEGAVIHPNVVLYDGVTVGDRVILHSGVVVGSDGFGYLNTRTGHIKIPHVGSVVIGNDVEIGANSAIDRGTVSDTVIGDGSKIDNLVQIGHNVRIGKHCIMAGQAGIAGSSTMHDFVMVGGQGGVGDHVTIHSGVIVGGRAGVISDMTEPGIYMGTPPMEHRKWYRLQAHLSDVPELKKRVKALEKEKDEH